MANRICGDLSYNNIGGEMPHGLPPTATYINLAVNSFGYSLAYPLPSVKALIYLNVSPNGLSGPIGDVFADMPILDKLDLSFNHLTGDLPSSFASLTNLHALYLQSNHFSGYVPKHFDFIPNLRIDGNQFKSGFDIPSSFVNGSTESPKTSKDVKSRRIPESKLKPLKNSNNHRRISHTLEQLLGAFVVFY